MCKRQVRFLLLKTLTVGGLAASASTLSTAPACVND